MMSSFVAVRAMRTTINNGLASWRQQVSYATTSKSSKQKKTAATSGGSGMSSGNMLKDVDPPSNIFKSNAPKDVGPPGTGKNDAYKNPEYFLYTTDSYAEMEVAMMKLRNPQPSSQTPAK